jgi:CRISPR-associated protein Cmr2
MRHLLVVSIGPVQEFIAAARRTRDLWFGSEMLSEVSRAAASSIGQDRLIFPSSTGSDAAPNVANVILAELEDGKDPQAFAELARTAAEGRWLKYAGQAWDIASSVLNQRRWNTQIGDVLEFYAAWAPLPNDDAYAATRRQVMRLLAGRKACRNFDPGAGEAGVPKSSLDGARESVWMDGWDSSQLEARLARRLRLSSGEQLDAVGVVKRLAGRARDNAPVSYPSVSRIAADPWLRGLQQADPAGLDELKAECRKLHGEELLTEANWKQFSIFPFEGAAAYRNRHAELAEETKAKGRFDALTKIVKNLERHGTPNPYLALLAADGDKMGKAISAIGSAVRHRQFSEELSRFANRAKGFVADNHGYPIYTGGDDVLALVALDGALECACQLREEFCNLMKNWEHSPTLTVGIAIGHFLEPLEDLLSWARAAEKDGKDSGRNALAVHLHMRGGVPLKVRGLWSDPEETRLDRQLISLAEMHLAEQIPDKAGYDLSEMAREYQGWPNDTGQEQEDLQAAMHADAARLIARKRARRPVGDESPLLKMVKHVNCAADLAAVADRVILARHFADAISQARGKRASGEDKP